MSINLCGLGAINHGFLLCRRSQSQKRHVIGDYCLHTLLKKTLGAALETWSRPPLRCSGYILVYWSTSSELSSIHPIQEVHSRFLVFSTSLTSYIVHVDECYGAV